MYTQPVADARKYCRATNIMTACWVAYKLQIRLRPHTWFAHPLNHGPRLPICLKHRPGSMSILIRGVTLYHTHVINSRVGLCVLCALLYGMVWCVTESRCCSETHNAWCYAAVQPVVSCSIAPS
jgi:hypothetical protein